MLRYFYMLIFLLISSYGDAQDRFTTETEVKEALSSLPHLPSSFKRVTILLKLSDWYLLKNERTSQELEQAYKLAREANTLSIQLKDEPGEAGSFLQLSKIEGAKNNLDQAQELAQKAIALFTALHLTDQLGESYVSLWSINSVKGVPYPDRIQILKQADTAFRVAGNKLRQADCLKEIGDLSQAMGSFAIALPYLQESLQLYKAVGHKHLQAIYDLLGTTSYGLREYKTSIEYGLLAAKAAEKEGDSSMIVCIINNHIGIAYFAIKDLNKAKNYFGESLRFAMKYNDIHSIKTVAFNYTNLLLKLPNTQDALTFIGSLRKTYPRLDTLFRGRTASVMVTIYTKLNLLDKADPFCKIVEEELARNHVEGYEEEFALEYALLFYYLKKNNLPKATSYSIRLDSLCSRLKSAFYDVSQLYYKFMLDSARGHYLSAFNYFRRHVQLKDSLFNEQKSKEINQLGILYETEKKDKNIRTLEQQANLQENRIKHEKVVRNFILAGAGLFILIAILLYRAYRTKQKNNKILQVHQEEIHEKNRSLQQLVTEKEWLVKEIHHRVKNNLHMVVGLLASQAEFIKGKEAREAINQSQHRIQTMSLIHQRLYQADDLSSIDMPSYIYELVEYLKTSFDLKTAIHFTLDIARVSVPLSYSIPIGLIVNEAVTNAIKYAFPAGNDGGIAIRLNETAAHHFTLSIHDDGIGLPPNYHTHNHKTLGITLMNGLSDDMGAHFSMTSEQGTHIDIEFVLQTQLRAGAISLPG